MKRLIVFRGGKLIVSFDSVSYMRMRNDNQLEIILKNGLRFTLDNMSHEELSDALILHPNV